MTNNNNNNKILKCSQEFHISKINKFETCILIRIHAAITATSDAICLLRLGSKLGEKQDDLGQIIRVTDPLWLAVRKAADPFPIFRQDSQSKMLVKMIT